MYILPSTSAWAYASTKSKLLIMPPMYEGQSHDHPDDSKLYDWGKDLLVVDPILLLSPWAFNLALYLLISSVPFFSFSTLPTSSPELLFLWVLL